MGLLDSFRPRVALRVSPARPLPGQPLEMEVLVDSSRRTRLHRLEILISQVAGAAGGPAEPGGFRLHAELARDQWLPPGRSSFLARAALPAQAKPDYLGRHISLSTLAEVRLIRRWRTDVTRAFAIRVAAAPESTWSEPIVFTSRSEGRNPYIEGSLDRGVLVPGGTLTGRVSVLGTSAQSMTVTLQAREQTGGQEFDGPSWAISVPGPFEDGTAHPFGMQVPLALVPSYATRTTRLRWEVILRAQRRLSRDLELRIPVRVAQGEASGDHRAPPLVGSERVARLWEAVAQAHGARFDGVRMTHSAGDVSLEMMAVGDGDEPGVEARIAHPDLGLAIEVLPRRGLRRVLRGMAFAELGEGWADRYAVEVRDRAQGLALLQRIAPRAGERLGRLDDRMTVLLAIGVRDDAQALDDLLVTAMDLAESLRTASGWLPLPGPFGDRRAEWDEAAARADARFHPGLPTLVANDGRWRAHAQWSDEGLGRSMIEVDAMQPIDASFVLDTAALEADQLLPDALRGEIRSLAEALRAVGALRIESGGVICTLDILVTAPAELLARVDQVERLVRLLRTDLGPYR